MENPARNVRKHRRPDERFPICFESVQLDVIQTGCLAFYRPMPELALNSDECLVSPMRMRTMACSYRHNDARIIAINRYANDGRYH